jgi:tRNA modification GTPase
MPPTTTICAISTPQGHGAIAILRLSGPGAIEIADTIFFPASKGKNLGQQSPNTIHFGTIQDGNDLIDEVLLGIFHAPHSYTGEDMVEISCHGAEYIQQRILQLLVRHGAVMARPGEFTERAFLNGKMDLSQAEAVADLIASSSKAAHQVALQQMRGGFSGQIKDLRGRLVHLTSMVELELDFSEEDVEFANREELAALIGEIRSHVGSLIQSFTLGNVIKNGVPVAIVGKPNVGKSTLLNALLKEDKAIVSHIAGTTRDIIEDTISIEGILFRFIDTAGIRETSDFIENIGIRKTYQKIGQAQVVLLLVDAGDELDIICRSIREIRKQTGEDQKHLLLIINKADTISGPNQKKKFNRNTLACLGSGDDYMLLSALNTGHVHELAIKLVRKINTKPLEERSTIITNVRHYEALQNADKALMRVSEGLETGISGDLLSQDIREVLHYLGEISGEITTDEILGNIFKNFCIGK